MPRGPFTQEQLEGHSARTKAAMADPAVRRRISERTKEGMAKASGAAVEMHTLRAAWAAARPSVRQAFVLQLITLADASEAQ